jgi:hypothetical protein
MKIILWSHFKVFYHSFTKFFINFLVLLMVMMMVTASMVMAMLTLSNRQLKLLFPDEGAQLSRAGRQAGMCEATNDEGRGVSPPTL